MKVVQFNKLSALQTADGRIIRLMVINGNPVTGVVCSVKIPLDNNKLCSDIEKAFQSMPSFLLEKALLSMPKPEPVKEEPADLNDVFRVVEAAEKAKHTEHTDLYVKIFWATGEMEYKHVLCWDEQLVRTMYDSWAQVENGAPGTRVKYLTRAEYLECVGNK